MAPEMLTEDDVYRSSTQYRLWSFTPESLASVRSSNNAAASAQARTQLQATNVATKQNDLKQQPPNLTPTEELALLAHSTRTLVRIGSQTMGLPTPVTATGAVYLRRFYLSHSPLTNPPRTIMPTCLFLATKTEHYYVPLSKFVNEWMPEISSEDIIREEGTVTQALRFCFEVRHPFRGLRGALLELRALAEGKGAPMPASRKTSTEAQEEMLSLQPASTSKSASAQTETSVTPQQAQDRSFQAHDRAKEILVSAGLLTDAYFLYTPAQLMFAALMLADEPLARFYLSTKLPRPPPSSAPVGLEEEKPNEAEEARIRAEAFADKLQSTIQRCMELLSSASANDVDGARVTEIEEKLASCRQGLGWDDTGPSAGGKRNGADDVEGPPQKSAKKRKLANGNAMEVQSPFGGLLEGSDKDKSRDDP